MRQGTLLIKLLILLLFVCIPSYSAGPLFNHGNTILQREFVNVYSDIKKAGSTRGTATDDNALAGYVGEYIEATSLTATNASASTVWDDIASIDLTAGDWDVYGTVIFYKNFSDLDTVWLYISTLPGNTETGIQFSVNTDIASVSSTDPFFDYISLHVNLRKSLSEDTTLYLKRCFVYDSGTPKSSAAKISARRVR